MRLRHARNLDPRQVRAGGLLPGAAERVCVLRRGRCLCAAAPPQAALVESAFFVVKAPGKASLRR
jgi:hypothetical protein